MKKLLRLTLIAATFALAAPAQALDFQTVAGSPFSQYFTITPSADNSLGITVSGLTSQYTSLSFEFLSGGPSAVASLLGGNLVAFFIDPFDSLHTLNGSTPYTLKIDGFTKPAPPGVFGIVSINTINGTITPVPEPGTFALLLAGLGLIGTIASRRRSHST